jgi:hypothetical protein
MPMVWKSEAKSMFWIKQGREEVLRASAWRGEMLRETREEERLTEDESTRKKLGPRRGPGGRDTAKLTPQQKKNIPRTGDFDGHTA